MQKAFSLVELSIVLVILGLLTGGILAGQSLIRAAELRSVATEYQRYMTATAGFRDKYFALPGDMRNAVTFWGLAAGSGNVPDLTCIAATASGTNTCNGDGDGIIGNNYGGPYNEGYESWHYWKQLANGGFIQGNYIGNLDPVTGVSAAGITVPISKISLGTWTIRHQNMASITSGHRFSLDYGNAFMFGGATDQPDGRTPILSPEEAWNIDAKLDDGKAGYGKWISFRDNGTYGHNCITTDDYTTAEYSLTINNKECSFIVKTDM